MRTIIHLCLLPLAFCLLPFSVTGCGRKGPPRAPEDVLPKTITDLTAAAAPDGIQLFWSRPGSYTDGSRMTDLGGFVVERATGSDPSSRFQRLSVLQVGDRDRFRQIKRFRHVDLETVAGTQYRYRVVSFTLDRYFSAPSNVVAIVAPEATHAPLPTP
jgi:predicted small lipoprotein YifL